MTAQQTTNRNTWSIVLAGGEGKRLQPFTNDRAKPAVPFAGTYRLIDFALSNFANQPPNRARGAWGAYVDAAQAVA